MFIKGKNPIEKLVIAWDLDGTLIDSSHRQRIVKGEFDLDYWLKHCKEEFIMKDSLLPLSQIFYEFQKTGFTQICVTARVLREADFKFFEKYNLNFDMIIHREDSLELDEVLKDKKLQDFFEKEGLIPFQAYDDKEENLKVFDKYGFRTFQASYLNKVLKVDNYKNINFKPKDF